MKENKGAFFSLRPDNSGVTYQISINKHLRDSTQANRTSCGDTMQCVALSNLTTAKDELARHPFTTLRNQIWAGSSSMSKVLIIAQELMKVMGCCLLVTWNICVAIRICSNYEQQWGVAAINDSWRYAWISIAVHTFGKTEIFSVPLDSSIA
jgi:hypothetical protein